MDNIRHEAWIDYEPSVGNPVECRCGACGYYSIIGPTKYCPECGTKMDKRFGSRDAFLLYQIVVKRRLRKIESEVSS